MKSKLHSSIFFGMLLFCFNVVLFAQVGIGTTDPKTALDVNGALSLREGTALVFSNGNNDNLSLGTSVYSMYRITGPTADFELSGIVPVTGADGQIIILQNTTNYDFTLKHNNSSTSSNSIYIPGEKDFYLTGRHTTITLQYSVTLSKWVLQNKMHHIETWYHGPEDINGGYNTFTATIPEATLGSSCSVNIVGDGNVSASEADDLYFEYVEARAGQVVFRYYNDGSTVSDVTFAITINKI
jgi:hypothetical protein